MTRLINKYGLNLDIKTLPQLNTSQFDFQITPEDQIKLDQLVKKIYQQDLELYQQTFNHSIQLAGH